MDCPDFSPTLSTSAPWLTVLVGAALTVSGCREAEISSYQVPKPSQVYARNHEEGPDGMLAAMIPRKESKQAWFFKISGLKAPVTSQQKAFRAFLDSVRFEDDKQEPSWTLPEGWQQPGGTSSTGIRYATILMGDGDDALELSVTRLPLPESEFDAYLLQNVNRWRGQIRLSNLSPGELSSETESIQVGGEQVIFVKQMIGHLKSSRPMGGPFAGGGMGAGRGPTGGGPRMGPADGGAPPKLTYEAPSGWKPGQLEVSRGGITIRRQAAFLLADGNDSGEVTVTAMPVGPRSLLLNVNRWRSQVALESVDIGELEDLFEPIKLGSISGNYLELSGPRDTILGAIVEAEGMTWFFKLTAPRRLATSSRGAFKAFVSSSRFGDSDTGSSPEPPRTKDSQTDSEEG